MENEGEARGKGEENGGYGNGTSLSRARVSSMKWMKGREVGEDIWVKIVSLNVFFFKFVANLFSLLPEKQKMLPWKERKREKALPLCLRGYAISLYSTSSSSSQENIVIIHQTSNK